MKNLFSYIKSSLRFPQLLFCVALIVIIILQFFALKQEFRRISIFRKHQANQKIGFRFEGLHTFVKGVKEMGYYTDTHPDDKEFGKHFSHAQYMIAPTVLDYKNLDHQYILFVCRDEQKAWTIMKQIDAQPLRRNKYGMILAKRN